MADLIGQRLGNYEIVALLGEGGMATVYRARQLNIKRDVAIKVIESKIARSPEFIKRFEREAQTIAALNHPHILKLFDFGQQGELIYLVMELQPGGSVADAIRQKSLSPERISSLLEQIASALDYAHAQGIIHRDLKPQNVLLNPQGNAILTDFGIAKILNETTALTGSGMSMGTPAYMAPEQWQSSTIDARADQYALGVMLFEMLAGQVPFNADTPFQMMHAHIYERPPLISELRPDLPGSVEKVIDRALAKDPTRRFQSASDLAAAFRISLTGQTPPGIEISPPETGVDVTAPRAAGAVAIPLATEAMEPPVRRGRHAGLLALGALVLVAVVGVLALALSSGESSATPTPTAVPSAVLAAAAASTSTATQSAASTLTPSPTMTDTFTATVTWTATWTATATMTRTPVPTATPTITPNLATRVAATIALRETATANAIASFTHTPTDTPTITLTPSWTPNEEETLAAMVVATETANAVASFTRTPTPTDTATLTLTSTPTYTPTSSLTFTPTRTPSMTSIPTVTPFPAITTNSQWRPVEQAFDGIAMMLVPPGCFMMGSTAQQIAQYIAQYGDDYKDEGPQTRICFDKPFWIDKYEVTNGQFAQLGGQAASAKLLGGR